MIYLYVTSGICKKVFCEYMNSIVYTYRNKYNDEIIIIEDLMYIQKKINENQSNDRFLFMQNISIKINNEDERIYLINTEQLSRHEYIKTIIEYPKNIKIIDYSLVNIQYLEPYRNLIYYLPYTVNKNEIYNFQKIYDVCTIGCWSDYRKHITEQLIEKGININHIGIGNHNNEIFGNERDEILFKHKILLNIHYNDQYKVFEEMRCNRCIMNKMILITQKSKNLEKNVKNVSFQKLRNHIIECEYEELLDVVIDVSNRYEEYYHKLFDNFNLEEIKQDYEKEFTNVFNQILLHP